MVNGKEYELDVEYEKKGQYESYVVKQMLNNPMDMNDLESYNFLSELVGEKTTKSIPRENTKSTKEKQPKAS